MYWRTKGINILPYMDDFFFLIMGDNSGCLLAKLAKKTCAEYVSPLIGIGVMIRLSMSEGI
jgi:hypothetical protein